MVAFSIAGATGPAKDWLPTHLFTAPGDLPKGVEFDGYLRATAVAVVLTVGALLVTPKLMARREI
jgi:hypothetical protein